MEKKLQFLNEVKKLAKKFGVKDLFAVADGMSLTEATGNGCERELVKELDVTMDKWIEKQR